ncbi:MAG: 50S ribosomal protein L6 [archaeon]
MTNKNFEEIIQIAEGCQASLENKTITVKGEKGEVKRNLFDPMVSIQIKDNKIVISTKNLTKRSKKLVNTFKAHIQNMFEGAMRGHTYKLKICSGHFPMTVAVKDKKFEIKNFIGEKVPRVINIKEGTTVNIDGSEIVVEGLNKEETSQMAASIEQLTRRPGFDKRIFQDGIYMIEKDGKPIK